MSGFPTESENALKARDAKREAKIKAARIVIAELKKLPVAKRPVEWKAYTAKEVSRRLSQKQAITQRSITRWLEEGKLKEPWAVTSCKGSGNPRLPRKLVR